MSHLLESIDVPVWRTSNSKAVQNPCIILMLIILANILINILSGERHLQTRIHSSRMQATHFSRCLWVEGVSASGSRGVSASGSGGYLPLGLGGCLPFDRGCGRPPSPHTLSFHHTPSTTPFLPHPLHRPPMWTDKHL